MPHPVKITMSNGPTESRIALGSATGDLPRPPDLWYLRNHPFLPSPASDLVAAVYLSREATTTYILNRDYLVV